MKRILTIVIMLVIVGCSSPPPPPEVNWKDKPKALDTTLPQWQENDVIVASENVSGHWIKKLNDFQGNNGHYATDVYYAVAHSTTILVSSSSKGDYFAAKNWLRAHGAKGVIRYQSKNDCLTSTQVDIYFSR